MQVHLNLPDDLYRQAKLQAASEGTTATALIVAALGRYFERHGVEPPAIPVARSEVERRTEPPVFPKKPPAVVSPQAADYAAFSSRPFSPAPKPGKR